MRTTTVYPSLLAAPEDPTARLAALILSTYCEMPGLNLNVKQVARMFASPEGACGAALNDLVSRGSLRVLPTGAYAKA